MPSALLDPVPHTEAVAFIATKPAVTREVFEGLLPELQARSFTIAGIENATVLQNVRDRLAELPAGADWDTVKADIVEKISPWIGGEGEEGAAAAERRAEVLMRTHGFQAYSAANNQVLDRQRAAFPYAQYITAGDDKVRDSHAALNGLILPADDSFWDTHTGPWEWGCRCQKVPMAADEVDEIRAAEAEKPVEERRVVEGPRLDALSKNNQLHVAEQGGAPRTVSTAPSSTFRAHPKDLVIEAEQLQARYDGETWKTFEAWAGKQTFQDSAGQARTILDWMSEKQVMPKAWQALSQSKPATVPESLTDPAAVEVSAVESGAKPVYHEQVGEDFAPRMARWLQEKAGPGTDVWTSEGHLFARRKTGPSRAEIESRLKSGAGGELLGYGAETMFQPGTVGVRIFDTDQVLVAGFRAPKANAIALASRRAQDWVVATGKRHFFTVQP